MKKISDDTKDECMHEHGFDIEEELANILRHEIDLEMRKEYGEDWKEKQDFDIIQDLKRLVKVS